MIIEFFQSETLTLRIVIYLHLFHILQFRSSGRFFNLSQTLNKTKIELHICHGHALAGKVITLINKSTAVFYDMYSYKP